MNPSESIWNNKAVIIPMAEVSHIIKEKSGSWIVFKHSKANPLSTYTMKLEPAIWLDFENAKQFIKDWCVFRGEIDNVIQSTNS